MTTLASRGPAGRTPEVVHPPADNPSPAKFASRMNASDALLWTIERDPCLRSTIVAISWLDRLPDWERLTHRVTDTCELIPRLRQRVVAAPFHLGPPRWERDDYFDLDYHLRRTTAPHPGDQRVVLDIAGHMAMTAFDKDRPLWEFTLVEGLEGGRAALIQKVHHSITDGVGGVKLAKLMLDEKRNPRQRPACPPSSRPKHVGGFTAFAQWLVGDVRSVATASLHGVQGLPAMATEMASTPGEPLISLAKNLRSIGKLLAPVTEPLSPVMTRRGLSRRFDTIDVSLAELLAAAHRADSSLNDAFLAGIAGGMRRYHEGHGSPVTALRVTMPINLRRDGDLSGSNRFSPARFTLPVGTVDATQRMHELGDLARNWRAEPSLPLTDVVAATLNSLPSAATTSIFGSMLKAIDFVATNVPGLKQRAYLAGAEVVTQHAFAPASGAAFSIALLSHVDRCCLGINADLSAVPDAEVLTECIREGFAEVLSVETMS